MRYSFIYAGILLAVGSALCQAANINPEEIGRSLTAAGSSVAADGPIPAHEGRDVPDANWLPGQSRLAAWKHRDEAPLYTIDASNSEQYADQLTPGQLALFKVKPDYKMVVYPTHRSCTYPDFVMENTRSNVGVAKLSASGNGIAAGTLPGIPFPGTQSGLEAMWNHLLRYSGIGMESTFRTVVSPRPGAKGFIETTAETTLYTPLGRKGANRSDASAGIYLNGYVKMLTPAASAGQTLIMKSYFDADQETFMYFPGQRRVRRMPSYGYDAPMIGYENQMMVDASFTFNGNPDRFDWKMVGEKNLLVPYNVFSISDHETDHKEIILPTSVSEKVRRYELHKVYVVEATVKVGMRHSAPKRVFYLDSDTYLGLVADEYDAQGNLWKVRESYPMPVWELGGACGALLPYVQYDLNNGRYFADMLPTAPVKFFQETDEMRFKDNFYTQDNLRAISER